MPAPERVDSQEKVGNFAIIIFKRYVNHGRCLFNVIHVIVFLFQFDNNRSLFEQSSELPYDLAWEFPRDRVNFVKTLGSGAFGCVWLAEADGIKGEIIIMIYVIIRIIYISFF